MGLSLEYYSILRKQVFQTGFDDLDRVSGEFQVAMKSPWRGGAVDSDTSVAQGGGPISRDDELIHRISLREA